MTSPPATTPASRDVEPGAAAKHERRRLYQVAAVLVLLFGFRDAVLAPGALGRALLARVLWSATLLGCSRLLERPGPLSYRWAVRVGGVASALLCGYIALCAGGMRSEVMAWIPVVPLAAIVIAQEEWVAIVMVAVAVHLVVLVGCLQEGLPAVTHMAWQSNVLASSVLAYFASREYGRRLAAEHEALGRLADSERRRAREQRLATVGRLAAGVAHEVNNPLTFVKSNLELLRDEVNGPRRLPDAELRAMIDEMEDGVERIRRIVLDLRVFAREDAADATATSDVRAIIDDSLRLARVRMARHVAVEVAVPADCPPVRIAPRRLSHVLVNLLINADDALEGREVANVWLSVTPDADGVRLTLEDSGPGFDEDQLQRVFEPFATRKATGRGPGLGLAVSREHVDQVGGTIQVGNREKGGARVSIWLPRA